MTPLAEAVGRLRYELYKAEGFSDDDMSLRVPPPGTRGYAAYLDRLDELAEKRTPDIAREFRAALTGSIGAFARAVPKHEPSGFTAPVAYLIVDIGGVIEEMTEPFYRADRRLFERLRRRITENAAKIGNVRPTKYAEKVDAVSVARAYLTGTPLLHLFLAEVPIPFPEHKRFEGQFVVGRQGSGKTNLLSFQILRDLNRVAVGTACVVVFDVTGSQRGQLINNILTHKRFARGGDLYGRLVYIDPTDRHGVIPINLMSLRGDADDVDAVSAAISNYLSIIGGLMGQPLTSFQEPVFRHAVQLAMVMPNPTLVTLREIIRPRSEIYRAHLHKLRPEVREYFLNGFSSEAANRSRAEIMNRLYSLSSDPKFARLFAHEETRLDFFDELNQPKVIVINCDRQDLKSLTKLFGRFYFNLITRAGEARAKLPRSERLPAYIYIDEADEIIGDDPNAAFMIYKLRQMNIGLIVGMQSVARVTDTSVRDACLSTAIKFANANRESARDLADDMACDADPGFLMNRPTGNFAVSITGVTKKPVSVQVPRVVNDRGWISEPRMTPHEFSEMMNEIRAKYYVTPEPMRHADLKPSHPNESQSEQSRRRHRKYGDDE